MPLEPVDFAVLVQRYSKLGPSDRKAVRASFSPADLEMFDRACDVLAAEERRANRRDHQYDGYSPWLAEVVEHISQDDPDYRLLTPATRKAIKASHQSTIAPDEEEPAIARIFRLFGFGEMRKPAKGNNAC